MFQFSLLSSGSRANCTYLRIGSVHLLIDCGLSCAQTVKRLAALGVDIAAIDAVLVTHEHSDHVRGIAHLSQKHKIPVVCSKRVRKCLEGARIGSFFESGDRFEIKGAQVHAVPISHDARDPVGYVITGEGCCFGQFTDLGIVTPKVMEAISEVDALVIESNHDPELLERCHYPRLLKDRIASDVGHLSNEAAARLLNSLESPFLQHAVLGHLSENSNNPSCARATVERLTPKSLWPKISLASRYNPTPFFDVRARERGSCPSRCTMDLAPVGVE